MNNQITIRAGQIEFETLLELINIQVEHNRTDTQTKEESDETNNLEDIAQQIQSQLVNNRWNQDNAKAIVTVLIKLGLPFSYSPSANHHKEQHLIITKDEYQERITTHLYNKLPNHIGDYGIDIENFIAQGEYYHQPGPIPKGFSMICIELEPS